MAVTLTAWAHTGRNDAEQRVSWCRVPVSAISHHDKDGWTDRQGQDPDEDKAMRETRGFVTRFESSRLSSSLVVFLPNRKRSHWKCRQVMCRFASWVIPFTFSPLTLSPALPSSVALFRLSFAVLDGLGRMRRL